MGGCGSKGATRASEPGDTVPPDCDYPEDSLEKDGKIHMTSSETSKASQHSSLSETERGSGDEQGDCQAILSSVMEETSIRRVRLITDNRCRIEDYYQMEKRKLGQGSFGYVCKGKSRETGALRAVKALSKERSGDLRRRFRQEILIMKLMDHPNIIKLFETFEDKKNIFLVMELCTGGDLARRLREVGRFPETEVATLMEQILRPVYYMHNKKMVHRDLKPENFLFLNEDPVKENTLKITDFGFACMMKNGEPLTTKLGTINYSSPQVLAGQYFEGCDVWSCGVIMYVLLCGAPPFAGKTEAEVMAGVKRGNYAFSGPIWDKVSDDAKDLIRQLLKYKEWERTDAANALGHRWIIKNAPKVYEAAQKKDSVLLDLRNFCSLPLFRRAAMQILAQHLTEDDLKVFRKTFKALDKRGSGVFTVAELQESFSKPELAGLRPELEQVASQLGGPSQEIGYTDFLAATLEPRHLRQEGPCRAAFRVFDRNGDGGISRGELAEVLLGIGNSLSGKESPLSESPRLDLELGEELSQQIQQTMQRCDGNRDGVIDFQEFKVMLQDEGGKTTSM